MDYHLKLRAFNEDGREVTNALAKSHVSRLVSGADHIPQIGARIRIREDSIEAPGLSGDYVVVDVVEEIKSKIEVRGRFFHNQITTVYASMGRPRAR